MKKLYYFLILFFLSTTTSTAQETRVFEATKDTYINTVIADKIQGEVRSFIAAAWTYGGTSGIGRSLMGFDICPPPGNFKLLSATLSLHYDTEPGGHAGHTTGSDNGAKFFLITEDWDENTTWASQPEYDTDHFVAIAGPSSPDQDYLDIDLTDLLQYTLDNDLPLGLYFRLNNETAYRSIVLSSRDHPIAEYHPKLEVKFESTEKWCPEANPGESKTCLDEVVIPNIFSPNKDQINDFFEIQKIDCAVDSFQINIVNRWGTVVYTSTDQSFKWNGTVIRNNKKVSNGSYFYSIIVYEGEDQLLRQGVVQVTQ